MNSLSSRVYASYTESHYQFRERSNTSYSYYKVKILPVPSNTLLRGCTVLTVVDSVMAVVIVSLIRQDLYYIIYCKTIKINFVQWYNGGTRKNRIIRMRIILLTQGNSTLLYVKNTRENCVPILPTCYFTNQWSITFAWIPERCTEHWIDKRDKNSTR